MGWLGFVTAMEEIRINLVTPLDRVGSGTIESACKQIASARLKIAGARWTLPGAITTAKARAAWLSDDDSFSALTSLPLAV